MVKIPKLESRGQLTTGAGATRRTPIQVATPSGRGQAKQIIGKAISVVAQRFEDAQILHEATKADTDARRRLTDLQLEADTTEDIWNVSKLQDKISKARNESSKLISLPAARVKFQRAFDREAINTNFKIQGILRKRQSDTMKATMLENIDGMEDSFISAISPKEKQLIEKQRDMLIDENIRLGVITNVGGFNLKEKTKKKWKEAEIRNAIAIDADLAKSMLLQGVFEDLTADETAKWTEVADKKIKRNKTQADKIRDDRWLKNSGDMISNLEATSVEDIIKSIATDQINPDFGNDLIKWKTDPDAGQYETDKKIWLDIANNSLTPDIDLRNFMNSLAKSVADKKIRADDAAELSAQVKTLFDDAIVFKAKQNRRNKLIKSGLDSIKQWTNLLFVGNNIIDAEFDMVRKFITRVFKENIPDSDIAEVSKQVIEDKQKQVNPNRNIYKLGEKINTTAGIYEVTGHDMDGEPIIKKIGK